MVKKEAKKKEQKVKGKPVIQLDIANEDIVLFQGPSPSATPGTVQLHSFGTRVEKVFGRKVDDVKADFHKISEQMDAILKGAFSNLTGDLKMDAVEISLGFTASGKLAFIAEAGVETSVKVTFKRPEGLHEATSSA
jgi:hypothetical protein